jgi:class 3 adenylate cyclase
MKNEALEKALALSSNLEAFSESRDLYVLFIDLCGSTLFKQHCLENEMPESVWIQRQMIFLSRTAHLIQRYSGTIVKTIGDELLATFDMEIDPLDIVKCCSESSNSFSNLRIYNRGQFVIKTRASIDIGECFNGQIIDSSGFDPIGTCVDRCARINKKVAPERIGLSDDFHTALLQKHPGLSFASSVEKTEELTGLGPVKYFEVELSKKENA